MSEPTDTKELVEEALNLLVQFAHSQITEDAQDEILELCDELAERFDIATTHVEVVQTSDTEFTVNVTPTQDNTPAKPQLKLIKNTDDDDGTVH